MVAAGDGSNRGRGLWGWGMGVEDGMMMTLSIGTVEDLSGRVQPSYCEVSGVRVSGAVVESVYTT